MQKIICWVELGNAGNVTLRVEGTENSGNLEIAADSIFLNQGGKLQATSTSGENANIRLQFGNSIEMRYISKIFTEVFNNGNGGNIMINVGDNVFAILPENSDPYCTLEFLPNPS